MTSITVSVVLHRNGCFALRIFTHRGALQFEFLQVQIDAARVLENPECCLDRTFGARRFGPLLALFVDQLERRRCLLPGGGRDLQGLQKPGPR